MYSSDQNIKVKLKQKHILNILNVSNCYGVCTEPRGEPDTQVAKVILNYKM